MLLHQHVLGRAAIGLVVAIVLLAFVPNVGQARAATLLPTAAGPCDAPANPVVCENSKPGAPSSDWMLGGTYGDIAGFGVAQSVAPGQNLAFKISSPTASYQVEIYRLGWYGGTGARKVAVLTPTSPGVQQQPACVGDPAIGLVDCGNWAVSTTWAVPGDAVSGLYVANFIRKDVPGANQFPFVVRDDTSHSDLVVQTSDQTWQAYNLYGGSNLYQGTATATSDGRAYKVSYNRPYLNSNTANFMNAELPMVRWIERNGYDVSYLSGVDVTRNPALLRNHKTFMSSGHDEYWNGAQRTGVEQARAAGVNLAFFSGNEMFWKTRFEPSVDGTATAYRTLVCYKETKAGTKIDPSPEWTGTWRDPRLSPPSDGGRPENALTGTLYRVNGYRSDAITVPAQLGKLRFWRNTDIATLAAGATATLTAGSLGYEWDEEPDNGFRPAGLIDMSATSVAVPGNEQVLLDYGNLYGGGTVNHSLSLYRDPSGALVFGAGTVQWSWGLDDLHLNPGPPTDKRMQQATVNLFADMGMQPQTLQAGLVAATRSTDTVGPVAQVSSPAAGDTVHAGREVIITGTATDAGGRVASVEVSVDGGTTWHRATPGAGGSFASWSYAWTPVGLGAGSVRVRSSDDSANLGGVTSVAVSIAAQVCPCTLFSDNTPSQVDSGDSGPVELGVKFQTTVASLVTGVRFYKASANTGTHTGSLWTSGGTLLATGTFAAESPSGWQSLTFANPVPVSAGTTYVASYNAPVGRYSVDAGYFTGKGAGQVPLVAPASGTPAGPNGVFRYGSGFPTSSFADSSYWVDVTVDGGAVDMTPPAVVTTTPTGGATGVDPAAAVSATFTEPVSPSTVTLTLTGPAGAVPGATTVAADGRSASFAPASALSAATAYSATVRATDLSGNAMVAATSWGFTTGAAVVPGQCPCTIFGSSVPTKVDGGDPSAVELGVRITPTTNTTITGVRFYKAPTNTGVHTGSLWAANGQLLATGTFAGESASGWQTLTFATAVPVVAGRGYVASYRTSTGHYSADRGYFTGRQAGGAPVVAPASTTSAGNGVYRYGGGYPTSSYGDTNYWVDVIASNVGADTTPPTVTGRTPAPGAVGVVTDAAVSATFSEPVDATTVVVTVTGPGGAVVAGTTTVSADALSVNFVPAAPAAASTPYTVSVRASDLQGNVMPAPDTWTFTTGSGPAPVTCPCSVFGNATPTTIDAGDAGAIELGMRITPAVSSLITGRRFYKAAANTGTHTGSVWTTSGTLLATGTFTAESATGWQVLTFATPVQVRGGSSYVVSYRTPSGHYSADQGFFATTGAGKPPITAPASTAAAPNGLYRYGGGFPTYSYNSTNYWVDALLTAAGADTTPPTITARQPATGATGVALGISPTASFSEPIDPATLTMTVTGPGGTVVPVAATVSADGTTATANPTADLALATTYEVATSAADLAGNMMAAPVRWSFTTTATSAACPCSLFRSSDTPAAFANDGSGVELGMRWTPSAAGTVSGVRFYKAVGDAGVHQGSVWSATGQLL
ncbi:MAG: DUF4082 domain-containing protein, partial [Mycobacteriaceae bacterium]